ncbi:MAG: hypothetical protein ACRCS8_05465 [Brevinema sp.]
MNDLDKILEQVKNDTLPHDAIDRKFELLLSIEQKQTKTPTLWYGASFALLAVIVGVALFVTSNNLDTALTLVENVDALGYTDQLYDFLSSSLE